MKRGLILLAVGLFLVSAAVFGQGKFSGYMFGDYYYNVARDSSFNNAGPRLGKGGAVGNNAITSSAPGSTSMQAFQFRRIYLTYDDDISEQFTSRFRLEADQLATPGSGATGDELVGGKVSTFVKDAYLTWKNVLPGSNFTFGLQPTLAYDISETAWSYRFLEKTIMDLRGIIPSRDLGVSLKGNLVGDGMVNYGAMIANGAKTSVPETDKYKSYSANLQLKPINNFQATLFFDYLDAGNKLIAGSLKSNSTSIEALFLNYWQPYVFNLGFEAFMSSQQDQFTATGATTPSSQNALGWSLWGSYNFIPELALVLRYDSYDPNTSSDAKAKGDSRGYFVGGLSWKVDKNVSISPNILYETYQAPVDPSTGLTYRGIDASVTARLTIYYVFL